MSLAVALAPWVVLGRSGALAALVDLPCNFLQFDGGPSAKYGLRAMGHSSGCGQSTPTNRVSLESPSIVEKDCAWWFQSIAGAMDINKRFTRMCHYVPKNLVCH